MALKIDYELYIWRTIDIFYLGSRIKSFLTICLFIYVIQIRKKNIFSIKF